MLNSKQKAALFEHLRQTGGINPMKLHQPGNLTAAPVAPANPMKSIAPIAPPVPPNPPNPLGAGNKMGINPNYIGSPGAQKFKKLRNIFGLG